MPNLPAKSATSSIGRVHFTEHELQENQKEAVKAIQAILNELQLMAANHVEDSGRQPARGEPTLLVPWYNRTDRPTQVISIFGERGQGKTATLYTLCGMLAAEDPPRSRSPYLIVPALDPEMLGHGVDVFTAIGYYLQLAVEQEQETPGFAGNRSEFKKLGEQLAEFIELSLAETLEGRRLMAEMSGSLEGYARRVASRTAKKLERMNDFSRWIDDFLRAARRTMLVYPIDDVDINREHSEELLQAVRLYLCHPRVVVILTAELEMIRRTIRNRLLKELPEVFTGGQAEVPPKENETPSFSMFGGRQRAQLLAQEYQEDDEYAQQFLFKVLPPAYRVHLRGLRADERPGVRFFLPPDHSPQMASGKARAPAPGQHADGQPGEYETIERVLAYAPLLSGVLHEAVGKTYNPPTAKKLTAELRGLVEEYREREDDGRTLLAWIGRLYPAVFPSNLRILLNQMDTLRRLVADYRSEVEGILNGERTAEVISPLSEGLSSRWRRMERHPLLHPLTQATGVAAQTLVGLQTAEELFMARFVACLAMAPEIQSDRHLFYSYTADANAFDGRTIREFWGLTSNIQEAGTARYGFYFQLETPDGKRYPLSDSSNNLLNIIGEYASFSCGSVWPVLKSWQAPVEVSLATSVRSILLVRWLAERNAPKPAEGNSSRSNRRATQRTPEQEASKPAGGNSSGLTGAAQANLRHLLDTTRLDPLSDDPDKVRLFLTPKHAELPVFLRRLRDASRFSHSARHVNDRSVFDRVIKGFNDAPKTLFAPSGSPRADRREARKTALRNHERASGLRLLGLIAAKTQSTLFGTYACLCPVDDPSLQRINYGTRTEAVSWFMYDLEYPGPVIAAVLQAPDRPVDDRFLTLLFLANQPLAPLLTAWKQRPKKAGHAASLLQTIRDLFTELEKELGPDKGGPVRVEVRYTLAAGHADGHVAGAKWEPPAKGDPVSFEGLVGENAPAFLRDLAHHMPDYRVEEQLPALNSFLWLLLHLQGELDLEEEKKRHATATKAAEVWDELVDQAVTDSTVEQLLDEISQRSKAQRKTAGEE
jgi:hypothetical protein